MEVYNSTVSLDLEENLLDFTEELWDFAEKDIHQYTREIEGKSVIQNSATIRVHARRLGDQLNRIFEV